MSVVHYGCRPFPNSI